MVRDRLGGGLLPSARARAVRSGIKGSTCGLQIYLPRPARARNRGRAAREWGLFEVLGEFSAGEFAEGVPCVDYVGSE